MMLSLGWKRDFFRIRHSVIQSPSRVSKRLAVNWNKQDLEDVNREGASHAYPLPGTSTAKRQPRRHRPGYEQTDEHSLSIQDGDALAHAGCLRKKAI
jgi:hypothetical protein